MPETHFCEHPGCTDFGCFGVGAVQRLGKPGKNGLRPLEMVGTMRWYCGKHRQEPDVDPPPPPSSAPAVDAKPKGRDRLL